MISITRIAGLVTLLLVATSTLSQAQSWWSSSDDDKAFLGVESNRISKSKAEILNYENRYGVLIDRIVANSGAEEAGLLPFDYIVAIDDEAMDWTTELTDLLSKYNPGDEATIHYYRKSQKKQVRVTFGTPRSNSFSGNIFKKTLFQDEDPFLGVSESRYNDDEELGVAVNIVDGATADQMGLKDGDVIQSINDYKMIDWSDISRVMDVLEVDDKINIEYTREGNKYTKSDVIKSRPKRNYTINNLWSSNTNNSSGAFLGIYSEELSRDKAERLGIDNRYGSYVTSVFENSAAKNAGLQPFDYIYGIDEYRVGADQSLTNILRRYDAGEKVELHFMRQGKNYKYNVTFGKRSAAIEPNKRSRCEDPFLGIQQNMRSSGEKGVRVDVVKKSTANALGMRSGDVIAQINGFPIVDWGDISPAIDMLEVGEAIKIDYYRAGQKMVTEGKIGSYCDTYGSGNSWSNMSFFNNDDEEDIDVEDLSIKVAALSSSNVQNLNRDLDMDLSTDNSLKVNNLKISADGQLDIFNLQFALPNKGKTLIQVFNKQGRQIYTYDLGYFSGDFSDEIDLMQDGAGDYYLQISQDDKSLTQKVTVQNK